MGKFKLMKVWCSSKGAFEFKEIITGELEIRHIYSFRRVFSVVVEVLWALQHFQGCYCAGYPFFTCDQLRQLNQRASRSTCARLCYLGLQLLQNAVFSWFRRQSAMLQVWQRDRWWREAKPRSHLQPFYSFTPPKLVVSPRHNQLRHTRRHALLYGPTSTMMDYQFAARKWS